MVYCGTEVHTRRARRAHVSHVLLEVLPQQEAVRDGRDMPQEWRISLRYGKSLPLVDG